MPLLLNLASHGYIIIAHLAAGSIYCDTHTDDQIIALEWMRNDATWSNKVNWDIQTGILGYSMGGIATTASSANATKIESNNIGAAVALHPVVYP